MKKKKIERPKGRYVTVYLNAEEVEMLEKLACGGSIHAVVKKLLREKLSELMRSRTSFCT